MSSIGSVGMPSTSAINEMRSRMFSKADSDGSGGVSLDEFKSVAKLGPGGGPSSGGGIEEAFGKMDLDSDGTISKSEFETSTKEMFDKIKSTMSLAQRYKPDQSEVKGQGSDASIDASTGSNHLMEKLIASLNSQYGQGADGAKSVSMFA